MRFNLKLLTILSSICLFMTAPFAKAQQTPTCVGLCTSLCQTWVAFSSSTTTLASSGQLFPQNQQQAIQVFAYIIQQQGDDNALVSLCGNPPQSSTNNNCVQVCSTMMTKTPKVERQTPQKKPMPSK